MFKVAGGHSDTQNGRGERVRLKQLSVFRYLRQPHSATTLKKWRGEESPSVLRRRGCQRKFLTDSQKIPLFTRNKKGRRY
ncbi:hypothetical protein B5D77_16870 [Microcystis sp. MC19]|nr:hypothetical protein B5D77_16870 [Microcystis sp. MC19]